MIRSGALSNAAENEMSEQANNHAEIEEFPDDLSDEALDREGARVCAVCQWYCS